MSDKEPEPFEDAFLRHAAVAASQYDGTCRRMAASILWLRSRLSAAEERGKKAGLEMAAKWHEAEAKNWFDQQELALTEVQRSRNAALSALGQVQQSYADCLRALALTPTAQEKEQER